MKKRLLSVLLALCMVLALLPKTAYAATTSGTCGANLQWNLNTSTMVLTITGSGAMSDYYGGSPWQEYASEIKKVVLSQNITYIGGMAFAGCTALESVNFPSRLTSIGYSAFVHCYNLTTVYIPDTVVSVGDGAFNHCTGLISARAPARVISNGDSIFSGCTSLTNVTIPDGTTAIGYHMFSMCSSLTSVSIPNSVTRIGAHAFGGCSSLTTVNFPERLEIIEDGAFAGCTSLSHVAFPDGLKSIGPGAFLHCTGLNSVIIPGTVTDMGKSININTDGNGSVFLGCTGLTSAGPIGGEYSIQYGWTGKIPAHTFSECTGLTSVEFPDSMSEIGDYAFYRCTSLTSIDLPDSMSEIGDYAFYDCESLAKATLLRNISAIGENTFLYCYPLTIYCYQYSYAHQYAIAHNIPFVLLDGEPDQPGTAQILGLSPQSGAKDVSYESENLPVFKVTFDRSITSIEATVGTFSIYRASDNELLYSSRTADDFRFSGATLTVTPDIQFRPATEYYITLEGKTIQFEGDAVNPAIKKSQWNFTTGFFSTVENVIMATNYGSQKTANIPIAWNDAWFTQLATVYNHDLATTAAVLSGATYIDNDASGYRGSGSIEAALKAFQFEEITPYNYGTTSDKDRVAFTLAVKTINNLMDRKPTYLVAVAIKGTDNLKDWMSNFTAAGEIHSGFRDAYVDLKMIFDSYIGHLNKESYNLTFENTKVFVTGHSRGAAVANLFGSELTTERNAENLYVYTFATPKVASIATVTEYRNIFNILNPDDLVPKLALMANGRFGIDLRLPSKSDYGVGFDALYEKMNFRFSALTNENYIPGAQFGTQLADYISKANLGILALPAEAYEWILQAHCMSLYYSWLSTCTPDELFNKNDIFKRIQVSCPVDVYVYDESNNIVASVVGEQVDANILAVSVENGEKTIDLPSDQEYSVKIVAREDGLVSYTVNELATETTGDPVLRTVEFYDIDIMANDTLTGEVNGALYTDAENYALNKKSGDTIGVILPDSDSSGTISGFSVTFDPNGGNLMTETVVIGVDGTFAELPTASRSGYTFNGWYTASIGGDKITTSTVFTSNTTVYAQWTKAVTSSYQIVILASPPTGGSVWIQGSTNTSGTYEEGASVTAVAEANSGYRFVRWTGNGSEVSTDASYTFTVEANRTLTAVFELETELKTYSITYDSNGGTGTMANGTAAQGQPFTLPSNGFTAPSGQRFKAWLIGTTEYQPGDKYTFTADTTVKAVWENIPANPKTTYTITTNVSPAGGGSVTGGGTYDEGASITVKAVANNGYRFVRWIEGNTTASTSAIYTFNVTANRALTAVFEWIDSGNPGGGSTPSNPSYQITTPSASNGTVIVTPTSAKSGSKVTITAMPNDGYTIDSVTVTDSNGKSISVTDNGDGTYTFMMPASKVTVTASFAAIETPWFNPFTDVSESDWFHDGVAYVVQNGLMIGVGNQHFNPSGTTSRGMIVTILYRLEDEPAVSKSTFTDVEAGQYYTDAVAWAATNEIVAGYGNNTFGPNDDITREQIVTILYRYAAYKGYDVSGLADLFGYTDKEAISNWALTAMRWANSEGLMTGRTTTTLVPKGTATRAETATILARFCRDIAGLE